MTVKTPAVRGAPSLLRPESLFDDYISFIDRPGKTARTYMTNLRQFAAWLNFTGTSAPDRQKIIQYRKYLAAEHEAICYDPTRPEGWTYRKGSDGLPVIVKCRPATVKLYLQSVKQFFKWTASAGIYPNIAENVHAPKIRQDVHKKEALTPADVHAIENSIKRGVSDRLNEAATYKKDTAGRLQRNTEQGKRLHAMYLLAVTAGLRTIELHRANVEDLATISGRPYLYIYGKGRAEADQKKPLAAPVYEALRDYIDSRADDPKPASPLFVATGNRSGGRRLAVTTISTMLKKAMQEAGYNSDRITAHSLRHTTGTTAFIISGNINLTKKYLRHKSMKTTEIYIHVGTEQAEAELAEQLCNIFHIGGNEHEIN